MIIPVSAVIATRDREKSLARTLDSLLQQDLLPAEFVIVDASGDDGTKNLVAQFAERVGASANINWLVADVPGAAPQRNQGADHSTQPFIWFFDDDIIFGPNCVERLWKAIEQDRQLGGVNAMIVNQRYQPPGFISRAMFTLMHGKHEKSFAGKVIGPAINLLPEDRDDLQDVVPVEWLNTTCTIYRREALPSPPFDSFFTGYSLMEDLALSLRVGKKWCLANVRTARIRHESQPGPHKEDPRELAAMELLNRFYVMKYVLGMHGLKDHWKLALFELFQIASSILNNITLLPPILHGKVSAIREIYRGQ